MTIKSTDFNQKLSGRGRARVIRDVKKLAKVDLKQEIDRFTTILSKMLDLLDTIENPLEIGNHIKFIDIDIINVKTDISDLVKYMDKVV